jgi:hypothetical protein
MIKDKNITVTATALEDAAQPHLEAAARLCCPSNISSYEQ